MTCMRIVDGWTIQVHKDHVKKILPRGETFENLPKEVQKIVGGKFDLNDLNSLAKTDDLAIIYHDVALPKSTPMRTRARAQEEEEEEADRVKEREESQEEQKESRQEAADDDDGDAAQRHLLRPRTRGVRFE